MDINQFYLGDWQVSPASNSLRLGKTNKTIEPKAMDVLLLLCQQAGEVLSADDIVRQCWGDAQMGDNPVHKAISQLRTALGDRASDPAYIETIRKRGYRVVAQVAFAKTDTQRAQSTQWQESSPFPGLSAFKPQQAEVFFGRQSQVSQLLDTLATQHKQGRTFTLLLGPSGSGKSSLVFAGVLPQLLAVNGHQGMQVLSYSSVDFAEVRQDQLLLELASALVDWDVSGIPVFSGQSADQLAQQLIQSPQQVVADCQATLSQVVTTTEVTSPHLFLFIDRLEVLLSSPLFSEQQRKQFLDIIEVLANASGIIIYSACRNDFYPQVVLYPSLMKDKLNGAHFDLAPPTPSELSQMIRLPAIAADLSWSTDPVSGLPLDEILINQAALQPDSLPLLQYTLQELYLQRDSNNQLVFQVFQQLGGIEGAIGRKAEQVFSAVAEQNQLELENILSLLVTITDDGNTITSKAARWTQLTNSKQKKLVNMMVENRLFVTHLQQHAPSFSVAHEALLRRWPRVSEWIAAHKHSIRVKNRLHEQTQRWLDDHKSQAYLLAQGKPLHEAIALMQHPSFHLQPDEKALITASRQRAKQKRWLQRGTIILLCLLTVTSGVMSLRSQHAESEAQQKRLEAESLLGFMVGEFADKLRSVKRMDLLDGISSKALQYFAAQKPQDETFFSRFLPDKLNFAATYQHAQTLAAIGEVAYSRDNIQQARLAFQAAMELLERLRISQPQNEHILLTLGANAFWLGQIHYDQGELGQAQILFEHYRDVSLDLNRLNPESVDAWMELAYAHNTLASLYAKQQRYSQAKAGFKQSYEMMKKVSDARPEDVSVLADMADALSWSASIAQHLGSLEEALLLQKKGRDVLLAAEQIESNNAAIIESLTLLHWQQAKTLYYLGSYQQARLAITESESYINRLLHQDPENQIWLKDLGGIHAFKLVVSANTGIANQGVKSESQALVTQVLNGQPMRLGSMSNLMYYLLVTKQTNLVEQFENQWHSQIAESQQHQPNPESSMLLAKALVIRARQEQVMQPSVDSRQRCEQALVLLGPLVQESQHPMFWLPYINAHRCLARQHEIADAIQQLKSQEVILPINHFTNP